MGWIRVAGKHCSHARHPRAYSSLKQAQLACMLHESCSGVYDTNCDGKGSLFLCRLGVALATSAKSCVYRPASWSKRPVPTFESSFIARPGVNASSLVTLHGNARLSSKGVSFDGDGDYITIDNDKLGPSRAKSASRSLRRALLMP